jgi:hypothetical protein
VRASMLMASGRSAPRSSSFSSLPLFAAVPKHILVRCGPGRGNKNSVLRQPAGQ